MPDVFISPSQNEKITKEVKAKVDLSNINFSRLKKPFGFLTAFAVQPSFLRYEAQEKDEKIVLFLRRHFFTNVGWLIVTFCLFLVPLFAFGFFSFDFIPFSYRFLGVLGWYMIVFAYGFERFLSWFFNVNIVTNQRIIDVNFPSILYKDISECRLGNIEDVSTKTGGFIRSFLNYGNVLIQTAGALPEINFEAIPFPDKVSQTIIDLIPIRGRR